MSFYGYDGRGRLLSSPTNDLIIANLIVFVIMLLSGDAGQCSSFACQLLAQENDLVFKGFYWQIFTSMFVHFGVAHILFNMFALYYFGRLNETRFGVPSFLTIYVGSGLLGNLMSLYLLSSSALSGGASGAIFGLVGAYVAIARQARHMGVALVYAVVIFIQSSGFGVNIIAHLFGLIGGLALGFLFSSLDNSPSYRYST
jgi:rhomboid protease GluP